jgi:hypothetical protein
MLPTRSGRSRRKLSALRPRPMGRMSRLPWRALATHVPHAGGFHLGRPQALSRGTCEPVESIDAYGLHRRSWHALILGSIAQTSVLVKRGAARAPKAGACPRFSSPKEGTALSSRSHEWDGTSRAGLLRRPFCLIVDRAWPFLNQRPIYREITWYTYKVFENLSVDGSFR